MLAKSLIDILIRVMPETRCFDRLLSHAHFLATHGRLALRKTSLNDAILAVKASDEVLDPLRVMTTDKEHAKTFLRKRIDACRVLPTLAILKTAEEVRSFAFPERCVIKPTHMSGQVIRRHNGEPLDLDRISQWLEMNYYRVWREANYRDLEPKIIVEPFAFNQDAPQEAKFFCYKGKVKIIKWTHDRHSDPHRMLYDRQWNALDASMNYRLTTIKTERPANLSAILEAVERAAEPFGLVRVDIYTNGTDFYIGEISHTSNNATLKFIPPEAEQRISAIIFDEHGDRCA